MPFNGPALLLAAIIAVLSPLVAELPIGLRLPMIVVEVALGIVIGPHMLAWASPDIVRVVRIVLVVQSRTDGAPIRRCERRVR